jgi:DNA-binding transcriptional LysR family regulator
MGGLIFVVARKVTSFLRRRPIHVCFWSHTYNVWQMELRHLRYFVAIAETKSFSRAAKKLHISQPPLSAQIQALEEELGARLLIRSSRGTSLTELGSAFLLKARDLLAAADDAKQLVRQPHVGRRELRIGIITPALSGKFAQLFKQFQLKHPDLGIRIYHNSVAELHELLKSGAVDAAVTRPLRADSKLMERHLEWHNQVLAIPADHPWVKRTSIPWKLINGARVLLIDPEFNSLYGQNFLHMCGRNHCSPNVDYAASDLFSLGWLVATGRGVAPFPSSMNESVPPGVVFRPFSPASRPMELVVMWNAGNSHSLLLEFVQSLQGEHAAGVRIQDSGVRREKVTNS